MTDVLNMLKCMKQNFKYYKTANISYMAKGNKELKKELLDMIYTIQSEGADQGRYIPAKSQNISKKFESVVDWFDGKINYDIDDLKSMTSSIVESQPSKLRKNTIYSENIAPKGLRRVILVTVCINEIIIERS